MDGFPNGRRLEDDVTRIELQAVGGVALAAIGLWKDDYNAEQSEPEPGDEPAAEQPAVQHRRGNATTLPSIQPSPTWPLPGGVRAV